MYLNEDMVKLKIGMDGIDAFALGYNAVNRSFNKILKQSNVSVPVINKISHNMFTLYTKKEVLQQMVKFD